MARPWLYGFIAASVVPAYVLPLSLLRRLELSSKPASYRRFGVHLANRFVQHGRLINSLLRRTNPNYRHFRSRSSAASLIRGTYFQERFHWAMFLFFLLTSVYAISHGHPGWALLVSLANMLYNLYPIWLQQYIRLRLNRARPLLD